MKRLIVLGNSHTGAIKRAETEFEVSLPGWDVDFFAAPGPKFHNGSVSADGVFQPAIKNESDAAFLTQTYGRQSVNLRDYDAILVCAWRSMPRMTASVLERTSVLGVGKKNTGVSQSFLRAVLTADLGASFGGVIPALLEHGAVLAESPWPSERYISVARGAPNIPLNSAFLTLNHHEQSVWIRGVLEDLFDRVAARKGFSILRQDPDTFAKPFMTLQEYAQTSGDAAETGEQVFARADNRHMNAAYGARVIRSLGTLLNSDQTKRRAAV